MGKSDKTKKQLLEEIESLRKENSLLRTGSIAEKKYRAVFEQSSDALILFNVKTGEKLEYNDYLCEMLGYTRQEIAPLRIKDVEASKSQAEIERYLEPVPWLDALCLPGEKQSERKYRSRI